MGRFPGIQLEHGKLGEKGGCGCQRPLGESSNRQRGQPGLKIGSLRRDTSRKEKGGSVERSRWIGRS